jgi:hypothetical protein
MSIPARWAYGATMPVIGLGTSGMGDVRAGQSQPRSVSYPNIATA